MADDRTCLRGCTIKDTHYATCPSYGTTGGECGGCAPRECRDGSLICDVCFGRMRAHLRDVYDLQARLRSIADPTKAAVYDRIRVTSSSTEVPAPVPADILDALRTVDTATAWANEDLTQYANNRTTITYLADLLLTRHPEREGTRDAWSVQDAVDKWGVERRDPTVYVFPVEDEEHVQPVTEWYDPPLTVQQAAERHGLTQRAVRLWVTKRLLNPWMRMPGPRGSVMQVFRASDVDAVAAEQRSRRKVSREQEER